MKYLTENAWIRVGDIPNQTYTASFNNGIKMDFYNNIPYIALADRYTSDPRILWLQNDKWQNISGFPARNDYNVDSDYSFYIDSKGGAYFSYVEGFVTPLGKFEIIKFQNGTWTVNKPFNDTQLYGNKIVLKKDQLYIAYTKAVSIDIAIIPSSVQLGRINNDTLTLENVPNSIITDNASPHTSLTSRNNKFFSFYLDGNIEAYVVKGALIE